MSSYLFAFQILLNNFISIVAEFNYPPSYYNPNYEYYNSPNNLRQTYNICPEDFYYFDYEPLLFNTENADKQSSILNTIENFFSNDKNNQTNKIRRSSKESSKSPKFQAQVSPVDNKIDGPFWQIFSQSYEKCCPLNKNRLKTNHVKDDAALYEQIYNSFSNQTHIIFFQSQGMFAILELFNEFQQFDTNSFNPYAVQVLSSSGFYLITKRDFNGAPTMTPIALTILLNAWPLLLIILIANAYAGIFIWFLVSYLFVVCKSFIFWFLIGLICCFDKIRIELQKRYNSPNRLLTELRVACGGRISCLPRLGIQKCLNIL